jgi:hypothetical protein
MTDRLPDEAEKALIRRQVARLRAGILAVVFAMVCGFGLWLATVWLVIRGGPNVGEHLGLLRNYLPGYSVTWTGSVIGFFEAALIGAVTGWSLGWIYNRVAFGRDG